MKLMGVSGDAPTMAEISRTRFNRNDANDRFMIAAAKLALELTLPTEAPGPNVLGLPERDEHWVRRLFERAVGGFCDVMLSPRGWRVWPGKELRWQVQDATSEIKSILPVMRTDIVLDHPDSQRRLIIDTKFTEILTQGRYRSRSLRSGYIYQIYAYLQSQVGNDDVMADHADGLLLHPAIGEQVDESVVIQGHRIRFATVDLTASSADIRSRLLEVCACLQQN
jgi:5-methylcytosine-specific restriction enzyme subunit McrC